MVAGNSNWTVPSTMHLVPLDSTMSSTSKGRMVLWVDAVGGFLVCPGDRIILGQAIPASNVDIPIQGDISRRHATILREEGDYMIAPASTTRLNGRLLDTASTLPHDSVIELGSRVRLKFHRPHPFSATALLTLQSHHRTQPAVDGVILAADAIVLGPKPNSHIVVRDWAHEIVLFRTGDDWICRNGKNFEVDGLPVHGQAAIAPGNTVTGEDFSLSLESV